MRLKAFLFLVFTWCLCLSIAAQTLNGRISGTIKNEQANSLEGATVMLMLAKDTSLQKTIAANNAGVFAFDKLMNNTYLIIVSYTGYEKHISKPVTVDGQHFNIMLPAIVMKSIHRTTLKGVTVTSQKKMVEQRLDRTIINVDAMLTAAGSNALDVLSKSPGVMVDVNGNISLNGKNNVLVLIDDKLTYMSPQDLTDYLKSLPAGILDKVELMSNPPAKYDASGNAIINIILKKNRTAGFNGNANIAYNQGVYAKTNGALNINYRHRKFNLFGNFSYSNNKDFTLHNDSRYFYNTDASLHSAVLVNSNNIYQTDAWNGRIGMDYFASKKTTLGIMITGNVRPKTSELNYNSNQYDGNMKLDSITTGYTNGDFNWKNYSVNLNVQHNFDSSDKRLTADADYVQYHSSGNQFSPNYIYSYNSNLISSYELLFLTPSNINILSLKADYTQPLKGNARFDAGIKSSSVNNDNQLNWFNQLGNSFIVDYSKSDHFIYDENINAAYVTGAKYCKRWAVQAGFRIENTNAKGKQISNAVIKDSAFAIHYFSLFPNLYTSYKLDSIGNHTLTLSYSRRISRPGYQQLNPFLFYFDKYTYTTGNTGLSSQYGNFIELRYNYKQFISITFSYGRQSSLIYSATIPKGDSVITRPQNYSSRNFIGVVPYISFSPCKWWSVNANAVVLFFSNKSDSSFPLIKNTNIHEVEVFNQFNFNYGWKAELTGFFPGKQIFGQSQGEAVYNISAGIQKNILKNQGSLGLKVNDLFYTMNPSSKTVGTDNLIAFHTGKSDTRQVGISFLYRFGKDTNARKRSHDAGGAGDEESRVK